jgi:CubicO group peptidase (beta-lactamase class C family)
LYGDGGIYSTARDLFRYDQALYEGTLVDPDLLLEAVSPARLSDGTASEYGFGWSIITDERGDFVAHGGGWAGFSPFFIRDYQNGNTVIQLTNRPGIRRGELAFAIYEILHGGQPELPTPPRERRP